MFRTHSQIWKSSSFIPRVSRTVVIFKHLHSNEHCPHYLQPVGTHRPSAKISHRGINTTKIYDQEVDQPEGLNIELRPHQRKSLKFCLDRENCPDEKLCIRGEFMSLGMAWEIYYSPVLKYFSTTEIKPVHSYDFRRNGFGKTAVTLALHLANPPPEEEQVGGIGGMSSFSGPQWVASPKDFTKR